MVCVTAVSIILFLPRDAMHNADGETCCLQRTCLSVRHTLVLCRNSKTCHQTFSPLGIATPFLFLLEKRYGNSDGDPLTGASNAGTREHEKIEIWSNIYFTIGYNSVYLTCSKKLTGSQLCLPHRTNIKLKCETKNKMMSVIGFYLGNASHSYYGMRNTRYPLEISNGTIFNDLEPRVKDRLCFVETMEELFSAFCANIIIFLAILTTVKTTPMCPNGCICKPTGGYPAVSLSVDCQGRPVVDPEQLSEQLDSLLSSNLTYGHLRSLSVINTPLTHVPRSVCRLTTLTQLSLDHNRLTRLPDNCLTNLTALKLFTASHNYITELQDGLFDGLRKLETIAIYNNHILSIGLRVFNGSAMLTSLFSVNLQYNRIQSLEPWPYYVGRNRWQDQQPVDLSHNNISVFTNTMGLKLHCGMKTMKIHLSLDYNPVKHISDLLRGWNVNITTIWCLGPHTPRSSVDLSLHRVNLECDCVDFDIYKIAFSPYARTSMLGNTYCDSPANLHYRPVMTVPLDQFVCEVTERCPPGCRCVHRPANATLHLYCSNANLTTLPLQLPQLPKSYTKYKLDLSNNRRFRRLEHRDYFVNTSILDVSNCDVDSIDFEIWNDLANIMQVFLDGNQLQSLPSSVATVSLIRAHLSLRRNPWKCSCDASWMSSWLKSVRNSLINPDEITCSSPSRLQDRKIIYVSGEAFCVDPTIEAVKRALTIGMFSVAGAVAVLFSVGVIVYCLRVKLYTRFKFHSFDRDECRGEDMDYDVFLSCSSKDDNQVRPIVHRLENNYGYRVCYHYRDFRPKTLIAENIEAVKRSKRTVCFLTDNFIRRFANVFRDLWFS